MTLALLLLPFLFASTVITITIGTTIIPNSRPVPISSPHQPHLHFTFLDLYSSQALFRNG